MTELAAGDTSKLGRSGPAAEPEGGVSRIVSVTHYTRTHLSGSVLSGRQSLLPENRSRVCIRSSPSWGIQPRAATLRRGRPRTAHPGEPTRGAAATKPAMGEEGRASPLDERHRRLEPARQFRAAVVGTRSRRRRSAV